MTALVVLGIIVALVIIVIGGVVANARSIRLKEQLDRNKELLDLAFRQKQLILRVEKEAMDYGYPADPLAYNIVNYIRENREKENS